MNLLMNISSTETLGVLGLPGHWEIIIIVLVILLLFGGKKLPELARGLGKGLRLFKSEIKDVKDIGKNVEEMKESQLSKEQPAQQDQT